MQPEKPITKKPVLSSTSNKNIDSFQQKLQKCQLFYRYRLPALYRQLRLPIYDTLLKPVQKPTSQKQLPQKQKQTPEQLLQSIYKKASLNSKYQHRQKMRFTRTPILKYLQYDFKQLQQKLKSKSYTQIYDDLDDEDQDSDNDNDQKQKQQKQYQVDPLFSVQALAKYKKKNGINGFIVSAAGYDDVKERLETQYGWTVNQDTKSLMYDYKHMSKKKNIDYVNLLDQQVVNHFHQNKAVTAKFGLTRNIRNICSIGKDPAWFFPRCFDVNDVVELENFYESFKETYVQSVLKRCVSNKGAIPFGLEKQVYEKLMDICIRAVQNQLLPIFQKITQIQTNKILYIQEENWQIIKKYQKYLSPKSPQSQSQTSQLQFLSSETFNKIQQLLISLEKADPQFNINKDNIWIVKPASLSRGRGIKTFDCLHEILDYVIGREISWVVQKYIENPLIIRKRKFDIRQWVLLTDFKPLRVWIYDQCYIRFCATTYQPQNLKDRKIHLTNNSVTKGVSCIKDGINENMVSQIQFSQMLQEVGGNPDTFNKKIKPQMERIAVETLQSVRENMVSRRNTFQVFGFDFMVDQDFRVWLIEVNSSPTMEYSTKVTTEIVKKGMSDLGDLVHNYMFKGKAYNPKKSKQLYGNWRLLTNP